MLTERASLFIIVFTAINIVACLWLMWWTSRTRPTNHGFTAGGSTQHHASPDDIGKTGHVWDGDLEELNNPLPRWWLGLFIVTIVFGAAYLLLYPELGNYLGAKRWSQVGQYDAQVAQARARLEQRLAVTKDKPLAELARDPNAMSTAKNIFGANCSPIALPVTARTRAAPEASRISPTAIGSGVAPRTRFTKQSLMACG